jgi:ABC-type transport system involved in multi-copper enzyme maturation permease subunit
MNWNLWIRQALTIARVELKRNILAKRWRGIYFIAFAPVLLLLLAAVRGNGPVRVEVISRTYAVFFQTFELRMAIFFGNVIVFSQMFRGEILEKTLHFYLLSPVRREVIAAGKYLAGVTATSFLYVFCVVATYLLAFMPNPRYSAYFFEGDGLTNLFRYVVVTVLACIGYGAVFLVMGMLFKNPALPAITLLGWEAFFFVLPETVQKFTVVHYLQSIRPLTVDLGPFAVVADPTPPVLGVPILILFAAAMVWVSGKLLQRTQVTYSAD